MEKQFSYTDGETPGKVNSKLEQDLYNPGGFLKIGGDHLDENSDPRRLRQGAAVLGSEVRLRNLRFIDSRKWHYTAMFILLIDFIVMFLSISFSSERKVTTNFQSIGLMVSSIVTGLHFLDMCVRIFGLRLALLRSNTVVADLSVYVILIACLVLRYLYFMQENDSMLTDGKILFYVQILYTVIAATRLILKPRARTFSKKLHKFSRQAGVAEILIPMESVRSAVRRIPGISAVSVEMMDTDLVIICGRDHGDMDCNELMQFLERALLYRPKELAATDFLAYLQDIDAQASRNAYSALDVVKSTLWHWASQKMDLAFSILVVCINATIIPLQSYIIGYVSDEALFVLAEEKDRDVLYRAVIGLLVLCVPFVLANYGIGYFQSKMISKATEHLQNSLLNTILRQDTSFFESRSQGDLNNLFASDISRVNALWQSVFWNLLNPLASVLFGFAFILYNDWPTGILAFAFTAVLLSSGPQGLAAGKSKEFGSKNAFVTAEFQNGIACHKVIRAYGIRIPFLKRFGKNISKLRDSAFEKDFWASIVQIYVESAMYIFVAVEIAALLIKTFDGEISTGVFFAFVTMLSRISTPVTTLGGFMRVAIGNSSSLQRLDEIIFELGIDSKVSKNGENDGDDDDKSPPLPRLNKQVTIQNLCFRYDASVPDSPFNVDNLTAIIPKGYYTCICGPSGSGKSTLLGCLMQFLEPESGSILVDGYNIADFSRSSFMSQCAVVFQEIAILNGTILENIRYGNIHATDQECMEAAALAECKFIAELKFGFNTIIGQHATTSLSGGQAQRVCLARAICRKPSILLLDESTSALDPETEASIIHTLEKLSKRTETTIISVTHRLQTALNADLILVLHAGRVAEHGTYRELQNTNGSLFSEMLNVQSSSKDDDRPSLTPSLSLERKSSRAHPAVGIDIEDGEQSKRSDPRLLIEQFSKDLTARAVEVADSGTPKRKGPGGTYRRGIGSRSFRNSSQSTDIRRSTDSHITERRTKNYSVNALPEHLPLDDQVRTDQERNRELSLSPNHASASEVQLSVEDSPATRASEASDSNSYLVL